MICQNCNAQIDNDLIFCTVCGARLFEPRLPETIRLNDSIVTQIAQAKQKKSLPFKWIALIIALVVLPAIFGSTYLFLKNPFGKNSNNSVPSNSKINKNDVDVAGKVIFDERIEIASGSLMAYPFTAEKDSKIVGQIQIVGGEQFQGYVYTKEAYDEHFPDANFKEFSFEGNPANIEQNILKGNYVLVLISETAPSVILKGKVAVTTE